MRLCNAAEKDEIRIFSSYHGYCLKALHSWGVFYRDKKPAKVTIFYFTKRMLGLSVTLNFFIKSGRSFLYLSISHFLL